MPRAYPLLCRARPADHAWASRDPASSCPFPSCGSAGDVQQAGWWSVFRRGRPELTTSLSREDAVRLVLSDPRPHKLPPLFVVSPGTSTSR